MKIPTHRTGRPGQRAGRRTAGSKPGVGNRPTHASDVIRTPYAMAYLDSAGHIIQSNSHFEKWTGLKTSGIIGKTIFACLNLETALNHESASFLKSIVDHEYGEFQTWIDLPGARKIFLHSLWITNRDPSNPNIAFQVLLRDRTEQKKRFRSYDQFFNICRDILTLHTLNGALIHFNPALPKTLGYPEETFRSLPLVDLIHPDDLNASIDLQVDLQRGKTITNFENRYRTAEGEYRWLSWSVTPLKDRGFLYAIARDVTDQKKMDEEVRELHDSLNEQISHLQTINQELESFAHSISHDLRAPLRHINGFAHELKNNPVLQHHAEAQESLRIISHSAIQLGKMIDALLDFSRTMRLEFVPEPVDLESMCDSILKNKQNFISEKPIEWVRDPLPKVHGDPVMLRLVLENLISNAVKYTAPSDRARIQIRYQHQAHFHVISIVDNGIGFEPHQAQKLWRVFQRLHPNEKIEGSGIGLATVRRIIQRHGGKTWADSKPGQGSQFHFSLPLEIPS